jgi:transcriptional regulator with XRE-family HTH domain
LDAEVSPTGGGWNTCCAAFGKRLKERRLSLGYTQAQLFEQTGITAAYISFIERGRANPTLDMMVKLAEAVGAEAWDMIRPCDEESAKTSKMNILIATEYHCTAVAT